MYLHYSHRPIHSKDKMSIFCYLIKKLIVSIHTHPVLEGPFALFPVPTPSLRNQLKFKNKLLVMARNCPLRFDSGGRFFI